MLYLKNKSALGLHLLKGVFWVFFLLFFLRGVPKEEVLAYDGAYSGNAENYYDQYGSNTMKFFSISATDGNIYFCSRGKTSASTSGTKYRTVGWQFHLYNTRTGAHGYLYYASNGSRINQVGDSIHSSDGYTYNLYYITLKQGLKDRLDSSWESAFVAGEVKLEVNACMTTVVNGTVKGSIDDNGKITGTVYQTFDGIANAANWSASSKETLKTYYNKTIDGLFHQITITKGTGISSTTGAGTYLYGTKVSIQAVLSTGYLWDTGRGSKWTGTDGYSSTSQNSTYTVGKYDVTLTVNASGKQVKVIFHKNDGGADETYSEIYTYGKKNQYFGMYLAEWDANWCWWNIAPEGYYLPEDYANGGGWSQNPSAEKGNYSMSSPVGDSWIANCSDQMDLYMIRPPKPKSATVSYKVYHYLMDTDGSGYDIWKTQEGEGEAGSTLLAEELLQTPEGFLAPSGMVVEGQLVSSMILEEAKSPEINLYYDRKQYTLTLEAGTGIASTQIGEKEKNIALIYYGQKVTISARVEEGYEWKETAGWTGTYTFSDQTCTFTMPAESVQLTASAILKEVEAQDCYLKVSCFLNGTDEKHLLESLYDTETGQVIGTFDVWIKRPDEDWQQEAVQVTDYGESLPVGTLWKMTNINAETYESMFYSLDGISIEETSENGEGEIIQQSNEIQGSLTADQSVIPIFTSWHKLTVGGYCDGVVKDSAEGYGTFDITVSGQNALGQEISDTDREYTKSGTTGTDVTKWEGYYPYGAEVCVSDIKKDSDYINSQKYADILYEGLYEAVSTEDLPDDGSNLNSGSTVTEGSLRLNSLVTIENTYRSSLKETKNYLLYFTSWYETILDQQGATVLGTEKICHTISKQAYYREVGKNSVLEEIVIPEKYGFVFQGYFTGQNGTGILYIDAKGNFIKDLYDQQKNQRLYAYWSSAAPDIFAYDSYYTLQEARDGKVTEEELFHMAEAWDEEEGALQMGDHNGTIFEIEGYDENLFLELEQGTVVPITYVAVDQAGNICRRDACVYIVDTSPQILNASESQIRFISKDYLSCSENEGGLRASSLWKTGEFYEILWACVNY